MSKILLVEYSPQWQRNEYGEKRQNYTFFLHLLFDNNYSAIIFGDLERLFELENLGSLTLHGSYHAGHATTQTGHNTLHV